ncbi:hypothetical protein HSBAA_PA_2870 (plasmid) [Vreelandella sulfidaeris]|uniref:Pyridine nucleotide-disulphide oxidoreductase N-terminal domain-containing protein n=1 Tax=Vreelandella sulfidaeris TaxID=115553 RepID=A0A455USA4_9GAMM|nr:hypothetical protein HSBAA_PA_2870 [Halomonas sulfidaeris]
MLKPFDPDLVDWLMESFRDQGIDVRTQTNVDAIERRPPAIVFAPPRMARPARLM